MVAATCTSPTASASLAFMFLPFLRPRQCLDESNSRQPVTRKQNPSTVMSLSVENPAIRSLSSTIPKSGSSESKRNRSILREGDILRASKRRVTRSTRRESPSQNSSQIVRQKTMQTAISVPACRTIENRNPVSLLFPVKYWKSERCPELETGRNSVNPWISPCRNASKMVMKKLLTVGSPAASVPPAYSAGPDRAAGRLKSAGKL